MKKIFTLLVLTFSFLVFTSFSIAAENQLPVVIINQVRGPESCCEPGNLDFISTISADTKIRDLPIAYAIRFDALADNSYFEQTKSINDPNRLGLLLEITPSLAQAAGVAYKGKADGSDWYHARNAFLIGYSPDERKKLVDTAMAKFKDRFGSYPTFTVAWMIDSTSLNYLHDSFGVKIHEITKEQYETDNYTLYGGIFNIPYIVSKNHPLIPVTNQDGMMILRQTVSDIDKNYGSFKSYYTSQPNDYLSNPAGTDSSYFQNLLLRMAAQKPESRFALLGLENSGEWRNYKDEFIKQLEYVAQKKQDGSFSVDSPIDYLNNHKADIAAAGRILTTPDFPSGGVLWYFGATYRARFEISGGSLNLTDLRIFPENLSDPYGQNAALVSRAYWVLPYLLDSSQEYTQNTVSDEFAGHPVRNDSGISKFYIQFGQGIDTVEKNNDTVVLKQGKNAVVTLHTDNIEIAQKSDHIIFAQPVGESLSQMVGRLDPLFIAFDKHPRFFVKNVDEKNLDLGWEGLDKSLVSLARFSQTDTGWKLTPNVNVTQTELGKLAEILQPDQVNLPATSQNTVYYWNNTEAVAGRNPVRLYIDPRNEFNRPTHFTTFSAKSDADGIKVSYPDNVSNLLEPFFVDVTSDTAASGDITLTVDGTVLSQKQTVRFFIDCQKELTRCLTSPADLKGYAGFWLRERLAQFTAVANRLIKQGQTKASDLLKKYLPS